MTVGTIGIIMAGVLIVSAAIDLWLAAVNRHPKDAATAPLREKEQ